MSPTKLMFKLSSGGQQKHVTHPTFKTRESFQLSVISYQLSVKVLIQLMGVHDELKSRKGAKARSGYY